MGGASMLRVALIALVVTGCTTDLDEGTEVASVTGSSCWPNCANSPIVDSYRFHDLSKIYGVPNMQGLRIVDFQIGLKHLRLDVRRGRFLGWEGSVATEGTALAGAV